MIGRFCHPSSIRINLLRVHTAFMSYFTFNVHTRVRPRRKTKQIAYTQTLDLFQRQLREQVFKLRRVGITARRLGRRPEYLDGVVDDFQSVRSVG